jgi:cullin 3
LQKKEVLDEDVFSVNDSFVSKLMKIKVPLISMKSAQAAGHTAGASAGGTEEDILGSVEGGRKSLLDSVIVRIMKTRKHMEYNALIGEVIRMVSNRFLPQPSDIKKRIEDLMERDYIERSPDNPNVYSYLA